MYINFKKLSLLLLKIMAVGTSIGTWCHRWNKKCKENEEKGKLAASQ